MDTVEVLYDRVALRCPSFSSSGLLCQAIVSDAGSTGLSC